MSQLLRSNDGRAGEGRGVARHQQLQPAGKQRLPRAITAVSIR